MNATTTAGIAPNIGPKYGIILNAAFNSDIHNGNLTLKIIKIKKVNTPIIIHKKKLPYNISTKYFINII